MATNAVQIKEVGKWRKMQQARENAKLNRPDEEEKRKDWLTFDWS